MCVGRDEALARPSLRFSIYGQEASVGGFGATAAGRSASHSVNRPLMAVLPRLPRSQLSANKRNVQLVNHVYAADDAEDAAYHRVVVMVVVVVVVAVSSLYVIDFIFEMSSSK